MGDIKKKYIYLLARYSTTTAGGTLEVSFQRCREIRQEGAVMWHKHRFPHRPAEHQLLPAVEQLALVLAKIMLLTWIYNEFLSQTFSFKQSKARIIKSVVIVEDISNSSFFLLSGRKTCLTSKLLVSWVRTALHWTDTSKQPNKSNRS